MRRRSAPHLERGDVGADALAGAGSPARPVPRLGRIRRTRSPPAASFEAIARNARENFDQAAAHVGVTLSRSTFDRLQARTEAALARLRGHHRGPRAPRRPRDTHGDLRLDHVYWFPDRDPPGDWVVVDCIEFDERFRHADPIADIAFLAMELALEGRGDLADVVRRGLSSRRWRRRRAARCCRSTGPTAPRCAARSKA